MNWKKTTEKINETKNCFLENMNNIRHSKKIRGKIKITKISNKGRNSTTELWIVIFFYPV